MAYQVNIYDSFINNLNKLKFTIVYNNNSSFDISNKNMSNNFV